MSRWWSFRGRRDRDLDDEIQAHLEMAARDRIERGEAAEDARLAARREFGIRALVKEVTRETWGWTWLEALVQRSQLFQLYRVLLERFEAIPGVRSAAMAGVTPIQGGAASRFVSVEGFEEDADARRRVHVNWVGPRYFATLGTPLLAGRDFSAHDEEASPVAIVNQRMARHYFGDGSAIGRRFTIERSTHSYEIVGVAADQKYESLHDPAPPTIYLHAFQEARGRISTFALRTDVPPTAVAGEVRRAVSETSKTLTVATMRTLSDQLDASIVLERLLARLSSAFAGLGALLAAVGLYGLLAFTVARRTNEIGIRIALGRRREM